MFSLEYIHKLCRIFTSYESVIEELRKRIDNSRIKEENIHTVPTLDLCSIYAGDAKKNRIWQVNLESI